MRPHSRSCIVKHAFRRTSFRFIVNMNNIVLLNQKKMQRRNYILTSIATCTTKCHLNEKKKNHLLKTLKLALDKLKICLVQQGPGRISIHLWPFPLNRSWYIAPPLLNRNVGKFPFHQFLQPNSTDQCILTMKSPLSEHNSTTGRIPSSTKFFCGWGNSFVFFWSGWWKKNNPSLASLREL